jgi:hypothetical protein
MDTTHTPDPIVGRTPAELLEVASTEFGRWYEAEPVPGEEDSLSHDFVREFGHELIDALQSTLVDVAAREAVIAVAKEHVHHEYVLGAESPIDLPEMLAASPESVLAGHVDRALAPYIALVRDLANSSSGRAHLDRAGIAHAGEDTNGL